VRLTILDQFKAERVDPLQGSGIMEVPDNQYLILIQSNENLGFAGGNNLAIKSVLNSADPPEFIFLLNNDTWVDPDCLTHLIETATKERASVVGSLVKDQSGKRILFAGDSRRPEFFYKKPRPYTPDLTHDEPAMMACGCAVLVQRSALINFKDHFGYFLNPKLFLYGEETDFCLKAKKLGHKIYVSKKAVVYHKDKSNSRENHRYLLTLYYMSRNAIFIANNVLSGFWLIYFHVIYPLARIKVCLMKLIRGRWDEARTIFEGLYDGYRGLSGKWSKQ
jgi:hypothetical protein